MYSNQNNNREQYKYDPTANPIENAINNLHQHWRMPVKMEAMVRPAMKILKKFKGECLLMPDMLVNKMYYLNKGLLKFCIEGEEELETLDFWDSGEYVLMAAEFLSGATNRKYSIVALEDCELVVLDKEDFRPVMKSFMEAHIILERIAHHKARRRLCLMEIWRMPERKRYAALDAAGSMYKDMCLRARLSHKELAQALGISVATISRSR